jgi:hypothetical protein
MENLNGLRIRIEGNSIKFVTPSGETFYKNLTNFKEALANGKKNFNAPASAKQTTIAQVEAVVVETVGVQ